MSIIIRPYQSGDEVGMCLVHQQSIRGLCASTYSEEIIEVWSDLQPEGYVDALQKGDHYWLAEKDNRIIGISSWKGENIKILFIEPQSSGLGVGRALMEAIESDYLAKTNNTFLLVNATRNAMPFYQKFGFKILEHKPVTITRGQRQVMLQSVDMRKDY